MPVSARLLAILLLGAAAPALAAMPEVTHAWNLEGAPVRVHPHAEDGRFAPFADDLLTLEIDVENVSPRPIERIGLRAVILDRDGAVAGYALFTQEIQLAPGERRYALLTRGDRRLSPGSRVIVIPWSADGQGWTWRQPVAEHRERLREIVAARGKVPGLTRAAAAENTPSEPGIEDSKQDCQTLYREDRLSCAASCSCGVSSHSCTCSPDGTITVQCGCYQCPPPTPGG